MRTQENDHLNYLLKNIVFHQNFNFCALSVSQELKQAFQEIAGYAFPFCRFAFSVCGFVTFVDQQYFHFKIVERFSSFALDIMLYNAF